ncbi:MAG: sugar phosphate nucleotidyltransferase [Pseudobdellovibrio sp.]
MKNKNISYIICAAGAGSRLKEISADVPKPLLLLNNKTLLERSLESLTVQKGDQVIVIHRFDSTNKELQQEFLTKTEYPITFFKISKLTSGQAETAALAKNIIAHDQIAIFNSDTFFKSTNLLSAMNEERIDGVIPCSKQSGNAWSFCLTEGRGPFYKTLVVAEKNRISDWCSAGFYYFRNKEDFFNLVESEKPKNGEFYIAPLYNKLIELNKNIITVDCEEFKPMGTLDQIFDFWKVTKDELVKENL